MGLTRSVTTSSTSSATATPRGSDSSAPVSVPADPSAARSRLSCRPKLRVGDAVGAVRYRQRSIDRWARQTRVMIASQNAPICAAPPAQSVAEERATDRPIMPDVGAGAHHRSAGRGLPSDRPAKDCSPDPSSDVLRVTSVTIGSSSVGCLLHPSNDCHAEWRDDGGSACTNYVPTPRQTSVPSGQPRTVESLRGNAPGRQWNSGSGRASATSRVLFVDVELHASPAAMLCSKLNFSAFSDPVGCRVRRGRRRERRRSRVFVPRRRRSRGRR